MLITNEKIEVTEQMMQKANMTRGNQLGIPVDLQNLSLGLRWKSPGELTNNDFDMLEAYFLSISYRK